MKIFDGIAELERAVPETIGVSGWHTVTQQQIDLFAEATGDRQWIHTDPVRAADGPFGTTIAHGYLTLSLLPMLVSEVFSVAGTRMSVNYGSDRVRYPAPVPVGSRLRGIVETVSLEPGAIGYRLVLRVTVEIQGHDKPACVAEAVSVVVP